jgi:hypothetical protein
MKTWYLFDVNPATPPTMTIDPGAEVTLEVRGAFADIKDIRTVPTPFTPESDGHPLAPITGPIGRLTSGGRSGATPRIALGPIPTVGSSRREPRGPALIPATPSMR